MRGGRGTSLWRQHPDIVTRQDKYVGLVKSRPVFNSVPEHSEAHVRICREVLAALTHDNELNRESFQMKTSTLTYMTRRLRNPP